MEKINTELIKLLVENAFLRTKKGFIIAAIIVYLISSKYINPFRDHSINLILHLGLIGIYFLFWLCYSGRIFYSPNTLKILFAIQNINNSSEKNLIQIQQVIESQMDQLGLSKKIRIYNMPSDIKFTNRAKAETFIVTRMIDLLIWGHVLEGKKNEENISEFRLNFSYLYRMLPEKTRTLFQKEIRDNLKGKYWSILEKSSFDDIQIVSSNITEVSLFIIGLCLYVKGHLQESLEILERLYSLLEKKDKNQFPELDNFKIKVKIYIINGYILLGENCFDKNQNNRSIEYCKKVLFYDDKNSDAHLFLARLEYQVNKDIKKAKHHTDLVTDARLKPLTAYNYAFFAIKEKDENAILKYYQKARNSFNSNPVDILEFLQKDFSEEDPSNILFHFAMGYINAYHGDKKIAESELQTFVDKANHIRAYQKLVQNANPLLNKLKRNKPNE